MAPLYSFMETLIMTSHNEDLQISSFHIVVDNARIHTEVNTTPFKKDSGLKKKSARTRVPTILEERLNHCGLSRWDDVIDQQKPSNSLNCPQRVTSWDKLGLCQHRHTSLHPTSTKNSVFLSQQLPIRDDAITNNHALSSSSSISTITDRPRDIRRIPHQFIRSTSRSVGSYSRAQL